MENFNARLHTLLDDMAETMAAANGVGLAAPRWAFCAARWWSMSETAWWSLSIP